MATTPTIVESPETFALLRELRTRKGIEDPYRIFRELRAISPIVRGEDGIVMVTGYADCSALVRNDKLGHRPAEMFARVGIPDWADHLSLRVAFTSLLRLNPPDHTRLRRLVSSAFTARRLQAMRPVIEAVVDDLLDTMQEHDEPDFVNTFAFPLPIGVIGELLGIPVPDRTLFQELSRDWSHVLEVITPDGLARADRAARTIMDYLGEMITERRKRPGDDLLSALIAVEEEGDQLSQDELITMAALLFEGGFETTANLMTNGLALLLRNPDQIPLLYASPVTAVEELIRYDAPVQTSTRVARESMEFAGVALEAGNPVIGLVGAANRDPDRFSDPERLDLSRSEGMPISFGGGIHYCLGAQLARMEAQSALTALLRRFPKLAFTEEPERRDSLTIRGFVRMPVSLR